MTMCGTLSIHVARTEPRCGSSGRRSTTTPRRPGSPKGHSSPPFDAQPPDVQSFNHGMSASTSISQPFTARSWQRRLRWWVRSRAPHSSRCGCASARCALAAGRLRKVRHRAALCTVAAAATLAATACCCTACSSAGSAAQVGLPQTVARRAVAHHPRPSL